jgi:hypothetical protein
VWEEQGDLDVRPGDPSVGSGDDREKPSSDRAASPEFQLGTGS